MKQRKKKDARTLLCYGLTAVAIVILGFFCVHSISVVHGATCPGQGKWNDPVVYGIKWSPCYTCAGGRELYLSRNDAETMAYAVDTYGLQYREETDEDGVTWICYYRCKNCGECPAYSRLVYKVNKSTGKRDDGNYSAGPGIVPWWECTVCGAKACGTWGFQHNPVPDTPTPTNTDTPTPTPTTPAGITPGPTGSVPTIAPTVKPTVEPTNPPTKPPTPMPTNTPIPTNTPTPTPTPGPNTVVYYSNYPDGRNYAKYEYTDGYWDTTHYASRNTFSIPTGYNRFINWNTSRSGSGTNYNEGDYISYTGTWFSLYAQWKPNTYHVQFADDAVDVLPATLSSKETWTYDSPKKMPSALADKVRTVSYDFNKPSTMSSTPEFT